MSNKHPTNVRHHHHHGAVVMAVAKGYSSASPAPASMTRSIKSPLRSRSISSAGCFPPGPHGGRACRLQNRERQYAHRMHNNTRMLPSFYDLENKYNIINIISYSIIHTDGVRPVGGSLPRSLFPFTPLSLPPPPPTPTEETP